MLRILPLLFLILLFSVSIKGQDCQVKNKMRPDGSILYFINPVLFFNSTENQIYGNVMTDKEVYFLGVFPKPFPPKSKENKLDNDLLVTLSNGKEFKLGHFDSQYISDTVLVLMFEISKDALPEFRQNDIETVKLNIEPVKGAQTFQFRLHKSALKEQLNCLSDKKN